MFHIEETAIANVRVVTLSPVRDERGAFVKTYHKPAWEALGIDSEMREEFFSVSGRDVLRGMHFQTPPHDHGKTVTCLHGAVLDVVVDLRKASGSFGQHLALELHADRPQVLLLPPGVAHGFLALREASTVLYKTDKPYSAAHDQGIAYDSFGFRWPCTSPIVSERDRSHPAIDSFSSPF